MSLCFFWPAVSRVQLLWRGFLLIFFFGGGGGSEHPQAEIIGTDLSPIQPSW